MERVSRRRYLAAIGAAAGVSGVFMAGCGRLGSADERAAPLPAKRMRPGTTLTLRSYIGNEALLNEVNHLWAAKHPDITLTHAFSRAAEITEKLIGEIAAGTPVDVAMSGYRNVPALQRHLANLEPYARRDRFALQEFVPAAVNQYRYGAGQYALPNSFPVRVGVYNATLFAERGVALPPSTWDAPGWTWNDFVDATRALNTPRADPPAWAVGWDKAAGRPNLLQVILFCNNNGGAFLREDGKECLLTQPRSREALQFMQDLIQRHHVAPVPETLAQPGADLFIQGRVAWASFGPASVARYRQTITFDWAVSPLPLGAGAKQRSTIMDGSAWMMLDAAPNKEEAWELVQTLVSPEYERAAGQLVGYVPPRRALMADYASSAPPKHFRMLLEASERTYLIPKTPWIAEADSTLAPLLEELWAAKSSANTVAEEAKRLLDPILQRDFSFKTT
ncbi:MAG: ABC transporter substrate-binding protein [Chloroflexota bacterium]